MANDAPKFEIEPECSQAEAREIVEAIHSAEGTPKIGAAGPGGWLVTLEALLASPLGQAALQVLEGFVQRGVLKPVPATK